MTPPDDVTEECSSPDGTPVELGDAQATDVCDTMPIVDSDAPDVFDLGDTTVTWSATDASDNVGSAEQIVTVEDTTPPRIVAPDDITEECEAPEGNDVDLGDFMILSNNFNLPGGYAQGDMTFDGQVDIEDFSFFRRAILAAGAARAAPVPEPSASWLMLLAAMALPSLRRSRTRSK